LAESGHLEQGERQVRAPKLLIGIGNLLRGDDAVGVEVAWQAARLHWPSDVEVYEAGTGGPELAGVIEDRSRVVVVDAIDAGGQPGEIYRLKAEELQPVTSSGLSVHDLHLLHALDETRLLGTAPEDLVILGVQVMDTTVGMRLSAPVRHAVQRVIELAATELNVSLDQLRGTRTHAGGDSPQPGTVGLPSREVMSWY
jgi:hydrogenase maturation protease